MRPFSRLMLLASFSSSLVHAAGAEHSEIIFAPVGTRADQIDLQIADLKLSANTLDSAVTKKCRLWPTYSAPQVRPEAEGLLDPLNAAIRAAVVAVEAVRRTETFVPEGKSVCAPENIARRRELDEILGSDTAVSSEALANSVFSRRIRDGRGNSLWLAE